MHACGKRMLYLYVYQRSVCTVSSWHNIPNLHAVDHTRTPCFRAPGTRGHQHSSGLTDVWLHLLCLPLLFRKLYVVYHLNPFHSYSFVYEVVLYKEHLIRICCVSHWMLRLQLIYKFFLSFLFMYVFPRYTWSCQGRNYKCTSNNTCS